MLIRIVGADFAKEFKGMISLPFPDSDAFAGSAAGCIGSAPADKEF
jgi:hypothetical protein